MLHLYDSKSARIQPLNPVTPGKVGIYLCGATCRDPRTSAICAPPFPSTL